MTVLFWMMGGMAILTDIESSLAFALQSRGINTHAILCDGSYTACIKREAYENIPVTEWGKACLNCTKAQVDVLNKFSIKYSFLSDYVDQSKKMKLSEIAEEMTGNTVHDLSYNGIDLTKHIKSSITRYMKGKIIDGHEEIIPRYTFTALMVAEASINAINAFSPHRVFMSHGIYVDWGPALMSFLSHGIPVVAYVSCYLPSNFYLKVFKMGDEINGISHHRLSKDSWERIKKQQLSQEQINTLNNFIKDRYKNHLCSDLVKFPNYTETGTDYIKEHYSIKSSKPVWGILCHINWDAVFDSTHMICKDFNDWILLTMKTIIEIPEIEWLVKIHPAEAYTNPESGVLKLIQDNFPCLPEHIKILLPDGAISPLNFYEFIDGIVTVAGTAGLEMATLGKPVILAGNAHYGGKGFTYDASNINEYKSFLKSTATLKKLDNDQIALAQKYAYCHFMQRQVSVPLFKVINSQYHYIQRNEMNTLLPKQNDFYDFICDEIMNGRDFIMNDSLLARLG